MEMYKGGTIDNNINNKKFSSTIKSHICICIIYVLKHEEK